MGYVSSLEGILLFSIHNLVTNHLVYCDVKEPASDFSSWYWESSLADDQGPGKSNPNLVDYHSANLLGWASPLGISTISAESGTVAHKSFQDSTFFECTTYSFPHTKKTEAAWLTANDSSNSTCRPPFQPQKMAIVMGNLRGPTPPMLPPPKK